MKTKSLTAVLVMLVLAIFVVQAAGYIVGAQDASVNVNNGLNTATNYNIGKEISAVWGLETNSTSGTSTWYAATITGTGTSSLTFTFPLKVHPSEIIVQTDNTSQSAWDLLNENDVYTDVTVGHSNMKGNISSVTMYLGTPVNDTGTTSLADKGISGYDIQVALYSNTVNNLGKNVQVSPVDFLDSFPTTTPQYIIDVHNNTVSNSSLGETFTFSQQWSYTAHYPLVTEIFLAGLFLDAILGYVIYAATPMRKGGENERVMRFQSRKERKATYEGIALLIVTFFVIGIMGSFSDLWGWGGAIAFAAGFAIATLVYTSDPVSRSYGRSILVGFIGGALLVGVNLFVAFGTSEYNAFYSGQLVAAIQAVVYVLIILAAAYVGISNTKRTHLVRRE